MAYIREQTPAQLRAHMRALQKMPGWHNPLDDRLFSEVEAQDAEIERLQAAQRRALAIADERSRENVGLRAENEKLRAALKPFAEHPRRDGDKAAVIPIEWMDGTRAALADEQTGGGK